MTPSDFRILQMPQQKCPCCGDIMNFAAHSSLRRELKANDYAICSHCRAFLRFDENMTIRELTQEEIVDMPANIRSAMVRAREHLREMKH